MQAGVQIANGPLAELERLRIGVQQLVDAYAATTSRCTASTGG